MLRALCLLQFAIPNPKFSKCFLPSAWQAVETLAASVILSGAKNLGTSKINMLRDSSSPAAPQNDIFGDFFSCLLQAVSC
jgi:hypothetical protein